MKTVRKVLAFMLAMGLMVSAMSVFAGGGYNYTAVSPDTDFYDQNYSKGGLYTSYEKCDGSGSLGVYYGNYPGTDAEEGDMWYDTSGERDEYGCYIDSWYFEDGQWIAPCSGEVYNGRFGPSSSSKNKSEDADGPAPLTNQDIAAINQRAEAEAVQRAANDEGFADLGDMYQAAEKNLSAGEFYNNAVTSTPGIENAVTVGQGGGLIVNGQVTNMSATISKVTNRAYVDSVRIEQEGRVLNVVDVSYPAVNATINFYMPGITGAENIVALQYSAGTWVNVEVVEVRADHVTLNMKGNGVVAFIAK